VVDRTVHGPYENYQTPEQKIPAQQLDYPWESCMTLGNAWGFVQHDKLKSAATVIHSLIEIVAKGGSLLLGVGPKPDGTLPEEVVGRLEEIGKWMNKNGEAIYNTRGVRTYRYENIFFTQNKKESIRYALACFEENQPLPESIEWNNNLPRKGSKIKMLESGETVKWTSNGNTVKLFLPQSLSKSKTAYPALAFTFVPVDQ
jgi:alpha-L-fucosidase